MTIESDEVVIVPFRAEHGAAFYHLNRAWLDEHHLYEAADEVQLADPQRVIIDEGGAVFVALRGDDVVGTAAVAPHGSCELELLKVTVAAAQRGTGLGRRLVDVCVAHARAHGAARLVLVSSSKLVAALRLYERLGFTHAPMPPGVPYATADVFMTMDL